ncbi:uncharacterized protein LOC121884932 isoform X2 [Thunnus maccoyii]|nr:uncharacterized protein LOC121884932 isoform X2 [Thunnus maccoyii]
MCQLTSMITSTGGESPAGAREAPTPTRSSYTAWTMIRQLCIWFRLGPCFKSSAGVNRKRRREQESTSRALEEPPERRLCENAAVLSERSSSPQPSSSAPQASLEGVQLEVQGRTAGGRQQEIQPRILQESVDDIQHDDVTVPPLWPGPYGPQPSGLPPSAFNAVAEMVMAWMTHSPYDPEMRGRRAAPGQNCRVTCLNRDRRGCWNVAAVTDGPQMCCCRSQDEIREEDRDTLLKNMIFTGKAHLVCCEDLKIYRILKIFFAPFSFNLNQFSATYSDVCYTEFWS